MAEWAVTTANASLEFDTVSGTYNSCYRIDSNHFINFWSGSGDDGFTQVFTVNTSTWAVTTAGNSLEFDTILSNQNSCYAIDSSHFISFVRAYNNDNFVQVFTVNTSTWAVTTANARLWIQDDVSTWNQVGCSRTCTQIDSNHFINSWTGLDMDGFVQVFTVNTSTWAVTTAADPLEFDGSQARGISCYRVDSNHFINFWSGSGDDGFAQVFTVNTSTWAITTAGNSLEFDTVYGTYNSCYQIDSNHFINFWTNTTKGFAQVFEVELPASGGSGTNMKLNVGDSWKTVTAVKINVGDTWKPVTKVQQNIGDTWKTVF